MAQEMRRISNISDITGDGGGAYLTSTLEKRFRAILRNVANLSLSDVADALGEYFDVLKSEVDAIPEKTNGAIVLVHGSDIAEVTVSFFEEYFYEVIENQDAHDEPMGILDDLARSLSSAWVIWGR